MRYLFSGGSHFVDVDRIWNIVDDLDCVWDIAIHGACPKGADKIVDDRLRTCRKAGNAILEYNLNEEDYPESGSYCMHWVEAYNCDEKCTKCGIPCALHDTLDHDYSDAKVDP